MPMHALIIPWRCAGGGEAGGGGRREGNRARLGHAGLPIPDGFCVDAEAYRIQLAALDLSDFARGVSSAEPATARRAALAMKLGLLDRPIVPQVLDPLLDAWRTLVERTGALTVVRS